VELGVLEKQLASGFNVTQTTSTGRVLDAAAALLGICRERTYDGEPAMKLESAAASGKAEAWPLVFAMKDGCETLSSRALMETALTKMPAAPDSDHREIRDIAASFQYNLARGIAELAARAASRDGMREAALSGGVAYNHAIRTTIERELAARGLACITNREYPPGDGCVSYGQCVYAGRLLARRD
jgi:hydrogenase maturation protein HypF